VAVALGSNLGERLGHLVGAVEGLEAAGLGEPIGLSSVYGSAPVGYRAQPDFLNAVMVGRWRGSARALLGAARSLEDAAGRRRPFPGAPRTLDVDLVFVGDLVLDEPDLVLPHPRWRERAFVLAPLAEVAPGWVDPATGETVSELWSRRRATLDDVWVEAPPSALRSPGT
jgi:2-amino-4-hydroxy-6-hydroxymethyldihydropteridine diphosphokinase